MRHLPALLLIGTAAAWPVPAGAQRGEGANAQAREAMALLRSGPVTAGPGETHEVRPGPPDGFPPDLLPAGAVPEIHAVSPSLTVVVAAMAAGEPFDRIQFDGRYTDAASAPPVHGSVQSQRRPLGPR